MDDVVADGEPLWRMVAPNYLTRDDGGFRPQTTAFFSRGDPRVSVFRGIYANKEALLRHFPNHSIAELTAAEFRAHWLRVESSPADDIDEPHADATYRDGLSDSAQKAIARKLSRLCSMIHVDEQSVASLPERQ